MDRQGGWSFVELTAAITLLLLGVLGVASSFLGTTRLSETVRDNNILGVATRNVIESLRTDMFSAVADRFGPGSGREGFWIGPDGSVTFTDPGNSIATGTITLYNDESAIPSCFGDLSGGFDLNANGTIETGPITGYWILPIQINLSMTRPDGTRNVTVNFILSGSEST